MNTAELLKQNILSPIFLCFGLGFIAAFLKSDLRLPPGAYTALSTYLMLAIGLKGGVALSQGNPSELPGPLLLTLGIGILIPIIVYNACRQLGKLDRANSAALAAHYGSVSAVTFIASLTFLDQLNIPYEGYMPALVAVMEIPGIIVALVFPRFRESITGQAQEPQGKEELDPGPARKTGLKEAIHEVVTGKSIVLLGGGLFIGLFSGASGYESVKPFFASPFQGVLCLFMLDMGLLAAAQLSVVRKAGVFIPVLGLVTPVLMGAIGVWSASLIGLSLGGMVVFGTLCASASYIAAPAAVRIALPSANPSLYLTAAVGITFPFNLALGIPLYYEFAKALAG